LIVVFMVWDSVAALRERCERWRAGSTTTEDAFWLPGTVLLWRGSVSALIMPDAVKVRAHDTAAMDENADGAKAR